MTGVISLQNACEQSTGQCDCKRYVSGKKCDQCADGFFNMEVNNHIGCEPCGCDIGGAVGNVCNMHTGQCRCRPRVEGLKCDEPIKDHYFPTLWHMKVSWFYAVTSSVGPKRYSTKQRTPDCQITKAFATP